MAQPIELLEKLAAISPRPTINLVLSQGVLAPRARWPAQVVGYGRPASDPSAHRSASAADEAGADGSPRSGRIRALPGVDLNLDVLGPPLGERPEAAGEDVLQRDLAGHVAVQVDGGTAEDG